MCVLCGGGKGGGLYYIFLNCEYKTNYLSFYPNNNGNKEPLSGVAALPVAGVNWSEFIENN